MVFSPDNELLLISSDTATIHAFHVGNYRRAKHNLAYVRKNELQSCVHLKVPDMLKTEPAIISILGKAKIKQMQKSKLCVKEAGNVSVPGVSVASCTPTGDYVIQVTSRWGLLFEILLYNTTMAALDPEVAALEPVLGPGIRAPDAYRLLNVYKLYDTSAERSQTQQP